MSDSLLELLPAASDPNYVEPNCLAPIGGHIRPNKLKMGVVKVSSDGKVIFAQHRGKKTDLDEELSASDPLPARPRSRAISTRRARSPERGGPSDAPPIKQRARSNSPPPSADPEVSGRHRSSSGGLLLSPVVTVSPTESPCSSPDSGSPSSSPSSSPEPKRKVTPPPSPVSARRMAKEDADLDALLASEMSLVDLEIIKGRYRERIRVDAFDRKGAQMKFKPMEERVRFLYENGQISKEQHDRYFARKKRKQLEEQRSKGRYRVREQPKSQQKLTYGGSLVKL